MSATATTKAPSVKQLEQRIALLTARRDKQKQALAETTLALGEAREALKAAKGRAKMKPANGDEKHDD